MMNIVHGHPSKKELAPVVLQYIHWGLLVNVNVAELNNLSSDGSNQLHVVSM